MHREEQDHDVLVAKAGRYYREVGRKTEKVPGSLFFAGERFRKVINIPNRPVKTGSNQEER